MTNSMNNSMGSIMTEPLVDRMEPLVDHVDQALRIRSKVNGSIHSRRNRRKKKTSRRSASSGDDGSVVSGISSACSSIDILSASYGGSAASDDSSVSESQHSFSAEPVEEDILKLSVDVPVQHFGDYRTITMNEFFKECLITDCEGSAIVHFFNENDPASIELDQTLKRLGEKYTACKFLRIDGCGAAFVCKKLCIDTFPTVLAIRNKVVLDRIVDFNGTDSQFEEWILDSIPLINGH